LSLNDLRRLAEGLVEGQRNRHATKCSATRSVAYASHQQKSVGGTGIVFHRTVRTFRVFVKRHKGDHRNEQQLRCKTTSADHASSPARTPASSGGPAKPTTFDRCSPRETVTQKGPSGTTSPGSTSRCGNSRGRGMPRAGRRRKEHALAEGRGHHGPAVEARATTGLGAGIGRWRRLALAKAGRRRPPSGAATADAGDSATFTPTKSAAMRGCRAWVKGRCCSCSGAGLPAHQLYGQVFER